MNNEGSLQEPEHSPVANTFAVLAYCWRKPTARLIEAIEAGELADVAPDADDVTLDTLRAEYTRLFVGPGEMPCPPYESVYRDRSDDDEYGPVMGATTDAVTKWYRTHGVERHPDWNDMPDHIATELEFVAYLSAAGNDDDREQFLDEHLRTWADEFLANVEAHAREPFYASLARTTGELLSGTASGKT